MRYITVLASALLVSCALASTIGDAELHLPHYGDHQTKRHEVVARMQKAHMGKRTGPSPSPHPSKLKVRKVDSKSGESLEELELERGHTHHSHGHDANHRHDAKHGLAQEEEHIPAPLKQATRSQVIERMQHHVKRTGPSASPTPVKREYMPATIQGLSDDSDAYDYSIPSYIVSTGSMRAAHTEHAECLGHSGCDDKDTNGPLRRRKHERVGTPIYPIEDLVDSK